MLNKQKLEKLSAILDSKINYFEILVDENKEFSLIDPKMIENTIKNFCKLISFLDEDDEQIELSDETLKLFQKIYISIIKFINFIKQPLQFEPALEKENKKIQRILKKIEEIFVKFLQ